MSPLFFQELRKLCSRRLGGLLAALLAANLLFLALGTRTNAGGTPGACKAVGQAMAGMTMEQKGAFLAEKLRQAQNLLAIDNYRKGSCWPSPAAYRQAHADAFASCGEMYAQKSYTLFTSDFAAEARLFEQLWEEYDAVAGYPRFLQQVQDQTEQLAGISIFRQSAQADYNAQVMQATARAYAGMGAVPLCYYPQQGIRTALEYPFTDLVLLAAMLVLALFVVRRERDSGLLQLVRSAPRGRLATALAKLGAFCAGLLAVTAALYGSNLLYCQLAFGLGPLDRTIQSVPFLLRCTLQISLGEYLALFLLAKWAGGFVLGLWVMLAALAARRPLAGWAGALALPLAMGNLWAAIPAAGHLNVLKYANLASLLQTNELLGRYRCLYWFGSPLPLPLVVWSSAAVFAALFGGGFCLVFARGRLAPAGRILLPVRRRASRPVSLWREEGRKLWAGQGAGAVLAAFAVFALLQSTAAPRYITAEETFLAQYLKPLSGPYTAESRQKLIEMGQEFTRPDAGAEIPADQTARFTVYSTIVRQKVNGYLASHPGAWLVYDTGYQKLFCLAGDEDIQEAFCAGLLCAVCFSGLFAMEEQGGMKTILRSTPLGRRRTVQNKLLHSALLAGAITLAVSLPRLGRLLLDYGLPAPGAPALSLEAFAHLPGWITLGDMLLLWLGCRLLACLLLGFSTLWLGRLLKNRLAALLTAAAAGCLPALLAMAGMKGGIQWLGCWPLFHAAALAAVLPSQPLPLSWAALLLAAAAATGSWAAAQALCLDYEYGL